MSVLTFPAKDLTLPKKTSTITVKHLPFGRYAFSVDGTPVADIEMARLCVEICKAIRDQQPG